jgi:predicted RNA binding protein YcfA (HicA-like mRNA interferase family)
MSRIVPVPYRKLVRVLEIEGFAFVRERGDHMIFTKPEFCGPS